jgi:hypothetical protein
MIRLANLHLRFMNSNEEDSAPTTKVTGGTMKGTVNFVQMTAVDGERRRYEPRDNPPRKQYRDDFDDRESTF